MLRRQQRININEAILLFLAFAVSSVKERKGRRQIRKEASSMLSPEQVMIGVPEMLRRLDFRIVLGDKKFTISLSRPIPIQDFSFGSAEAWGQLPVC